MFPTAGKRLYFKTLEPLCYHKGKQFQFIPNIMAELALAITPLIVDALKAYRTAYRHFHVFRNYSREVKRIYNKFEVQQCLFLSELENLLEKTMGDVTEIRPMLNDLDGVGWKRKSLNDAISNLLGRDYEVYADLLQSIASQLRQLQVDLACFDGLTKGQSPVI